MIVIFAYRSVHVLLFSRKDLNQGTTALVTLTPKAQSLNLNRLNSTPESPPKLNPTNPETLKLKRHAWRVRGPSQRVKGGIGFVSGLRGGIIQVVLCSIRGNQQPFLSRPDPPTGLILFLQPAGQSRFLHAGPGMYKPLHCHCAFKKGSVPTDDEEQLVPSLGWTPKPFDKYQYMGSLIKAIKENIKYPRGLPSSPKPDQRLRPLGILNMGPHARVSPSRDTKKRDDGALNTKP